ncbi:undecaprenyl-diphosphate phosphatase [Desulfothermus okinawensis]
MDIMLKATIMGIVEGLTEFLPISSTGHLIIVGDLLNFTGEKAKIFEVVIQLGAILSVVCIYWERFYGLIKPSNKKFSGIYGLYLLFLTSLPASILGLLFERRIKEYLFYPKSVAMALFVGGILIFIVEGLKKKQKFISLDEITPYLALGIGFFQCFALWPGFSRSAATIMGAMILGASRKLAAEYSFIAAVPIMVAATSLEMVKNYSLFSLNDLVVLSMGFVVSFISAYIAVKGFIHLLSKITLRPFGVYRVILAVLVLMFMKS